MIEWNEEDKFTFPLQPLGDGVLLEVPEAFSQKFPLLPGSTINVVIEDAVMMYDSRGAILAVMTKEFDLSAMTTTVYAKQLVPSEQCEVERLLQENGISLAPE